jgi:hypothetical protein
VGVRQVVAGLGATVLLLTACSSSREARPITRPTSPPATSGAPETTGGGSQVPPTSSETTTAASEGSTPPASATSPPSTSTTTTAPGATTEIRGSAIAGTTGPALPVGPPYSGADPFAEVVRLNDGTCVGWSGSQGGSTAGLEAGARVLVLDVERDEEIGRGRIEGSRWEDVSRGGRQWNCFFDFTATVTGAPDEFRIRVAALEPWLTRPNPANPDRFVASVSTNADIGLIPSCPPLPEENEERPRRTTTTTTAPARFVSGWRAIGRYWSQGVGSLCRAGLPVTAIARPCRPPRVGSEYISEVVDSNDSTISYRDGQRVRVGTQMTVVVATGRLCD